MKVSVCITVFNEEESIESLLSSLVDQTKVPDEIMIVDGESTDKTVDNIKKFKSKYKENIKSRNIRINLIIKKCTRAGGRNISVREAKYDIIAMTDAGCVANKDWVLNITKPFGKSCTKIVAGFYDMTGEKPIQKAAKIFLGVLPEDFNDNFLPSTRSIAFKKEMWKEVGGFPEDLEDTAEDTIFNYRILKNDVKIIRVKDARVEWGMPSSIKDIAYKMYSYAKGDAKSSVIIFPSKGSASHNIKVLLKLIRYIFFFVVLLSVFFINSAYAIFLSFTLFLYTLYSFYKIHAKTEDIKVGLWGILLQYVSDIAGIWGFVKGRYEIFKKK